MRLNTPSIVFLTLSLAVVIMASACMRVWTKPGITEQGFATDSYGCERDVRWVWLLRYGASWFACHAGLL